MKAVVDLGELEKLIKDCGTAGTISWATYQGYNQAIDDIKRICKPHEAERDGEALKIVLDFVERWNKQDSEKRVAEAARVLKEVSKD